MTIREMLTDLALAGWKLWMEDGQLRYRAPEQAADGRTLAQLRKRKAEVLAFLDEERGLFEMSPLAHHQRALWFLWALAPESSAYNQSVTFYPARGSDARPWKRAAMRLVERHSMLRTRFLEWRGEPAQQTLPTGVMDWREHSLEAMPANEREQRLTEAHLEPFGLAGQPPVRFSWFCFADGRRILLLTMHHLVCDGWSIELIRRELPAIQAALEAGFEPDLGTPGSYFDAVRWQRTLLSGAEGEKLWSYWRERLAEPRPVLALPLDHPRPPIQRYGGASVRFTVAPEQAAAMRAFVRSCGGTLPAVMLAAWFALLFRWTGAREALIGMPTAGRSRPGQETTVGYFVDPVVIRAGIEPGATFETLVGTVRQAMFGALEHRDFPFALLVERLRVERDPSRSPLFDVAFNFLSRREEPAEDQREQPSPAEGKFELTLTIHEEGERVEGVLAYRSDLFERATVVRLCRAYVTLLGCVSEHTRMPVETLPLGTEAMQAGAQGRAEAVPAPALVGGASRGEPLAVHRAFEQQARREPERLAVAAADGRLSYAELNRGANRLAWRLIAEGLQPGRCAGVSTGRSTWFAVSMLAILKAGGAYVPIDPEHPPELREYFVRQARASMVVVEPGMEAQWQIPGVRVIPAGVELPGGETDPGVAVPNGALAYVIYTSGSTGRPKGVAVSHAALANYVAGVRENLELEDGWNYGFVSTIGADLGHTAIFPALTSGGALCILPPQAVLDGGAFADWMESHQVDVLKIVPSHLAALTTAARGRQTLPRRVLVLGGEGAAVHWVEELTRMAPTCRIFNHYGPTEATVGVMTGRYTASRTEESATLTLDRALANTSIYLLDSADQPVPPGFPGEVAIAGRCLAEAYIGDEKETKARFAELPGIGRVYRTGDLARQRISGALELLGRADRQVSIRGFRVELGQVEGVLGSHPQVRRAVALPIRHQGEIAHLTAWVECSAEGELDRAELRSQLMELTRRSLPRYMVPERLGVLERMPLTANGKVDMRQLETLEAPDQEDGWSEPRDFVELRLARLWAEVLGVPQVGLREDFFALGGHSLLCVRLSARIDEEFGVRLPLAAFLTHRTVERLARELRQGPAPAGSRLIPLRSGHSAAPLILLPGAGGSPVYLFALAQALPVEVPVWSLEWLDNEAAGSVEEMAETARKLVEGEIGRGAPYRLAGHSLGALVGYEMARQWERLGQPVELLAVLDNAAPGHAEAGCEDWDQRQWLRHVAIRMEKLYRTKLGARDEALGEDALVERMVGAGLLPAETSRRHFARFLDIYRANARGAARYRPAPTPLSARVAVFRATERDEELAGTPAQESERTLGWDLYAAGEVELIDTPGTHITMLMEPHVRSLAGLLAERLALERGSVEAFAIRV